MLDIFTSAGVEVIRIGLQSSDNLSDPDSSIAGANHPALGELVIGEVYYKRICKLLSDSKISENENITVLVSRGALSKAVGQNRKNKLRLTERYKNLRFAEADGIPMYGVQLHFNNGEMKCI